MRATINILFISNVGTGGPNLETALKKVGNNGAIMRTNSMADAEKIMNEQAAHIVIVDIGFYNETTLHLMKQIKERSPETAIILFSSHIEIFARVYKKMFSADFFIDISTSPKEIQKIFNKILECHELDLGKSHFDKTI